MRALRLLLIVDALALAAASTISDPILADVAMAPALLVAVIVATACLSGDLVPPRRRLAVACSALTIVAAFPFLLLPGRLGPAAAAAAIILLQVGPLARGGRGGGVATLPAALRIIVAALVATTMLLLLVVAALVWYGSTYPRRPAATDFVRAPYLTRVKRDARAAGMAGEGRPGTRRHRHPRSRWALRRSTGRDGERPDGPRRGTCADQPVNQ